MDRLLENGSGVKEIDNLRRGRDRIDKLRLADWTV